MANIDFQNGLIVGLAAGSTQNKVYTNWGDTITDDWNTIIANATAGTVSGYTAGQTKTFEFVYDGIPMAMRCRLIGKNHNTISGTQNTAPLTLLFEDLQFSNAMGSSATNTGGYVAGILKPFIEDIYNYFPSNIKNAIKTVDVICDADGDTLQTIQAKVFPLSTVEAGITTGNVTAGQGTAYEYFTDNASRVKRNLKANNTWWTRSRNTGGTGFYVINTAGSITGANATTSATGVAIAFCI